MAEKNNPNPTTGEETDISKAQSQQQPPEQAKQKPETGEQSGQFETGEQRGQFETGEAETGQSEEGLQGETATRQRTDIEGASLQSEKGEAESGFVGSEGQRDTSGELIQDEEEDEEGFKPDGQ